MRARPTRRRLAPDRSVQRAPASLTRMSAPTRSAVRPFVARVTRRLLGAERAERVLRPLFRTGDRECPVCGARCDRFVPLAPFLARTATEKGFPFGPDDMETLNAGEYSCPVCLESDRSRLYALYLKRALAPAGSDAASRIFVDFAPSAALSRFIRALPGVRYRSADLYMPDVDDRADLMDLGCYADASVDAFLCSHVLEHVSDHRRAIAELHRILTPGGWGIVMAPIALPLAHTHEVPGVESEADRWRHNGQGDHARLFARGDFLADLRRGGFAVRELGRDAFPAGEWERAGIADRSVLYVAEKR